MASSFLLYGANGYTGGLIARRAVAEGLAPILCGRRREAIEPLARELRLDHRVAALDDPAALDRALQGMPLVLHCAGPFARTAQAMVDACLRARAHYLDVTGEIEVFEGLARRDAAARGAGVMLLPGAGFDVVPSDCLALHLKGRLPSATHLVLGLKPVSSRLSHGTATTVFENAHKGGSIRRDGVITPVPAGARTRQIDFGRGPQEAVLLPWGDVSTAWYSTAIPNIEVYAALNGLARLGVRSTRYLGGIIGTRPVQRLLKAFIPEGGPTEEERLRGRSILWGEVRNVAGERRVSRIETPEGYDMTAMAALAIARRALQGDAPRGFQTPAKAYGADLVTGLPGVRREDL